MTKRKSDQLSLKFEEKEDDYFTVRFLLKNGGHVDMRCKDFEYYSNSLFPEDFVDDIIATQDPNCKVYSINLQEVVAIYRLGDDNHAR